MESDTAWLVRTPDEIVDGDWVSNNGMEPANRVHQGMEQWDETSRGRVRTQRLCQVFYAVS
jgi:hypothetical protein